MLAITAWHTLTFAAALARAEPGPACDGRVQGRVVDAQTGAPDLGGWAMLSPKQEAELEELRLRNIERKLQRRGGLESACRVAV